MTKKSIHFLTLVIIFSATCGISSQNFSLDLLSTRSIENKFLSKVKYQKIHLDSLDLYNEINRIQKLIKLNGYFLSSIDSSIFKNKTYKVYFNLNKKVDSVALKYTNLPNFIIERYPFKKNHLEIPVNQLEIVLNKIIDSYERKGNAFSKIKLENFKIKGKTLFTEIRFTTSKKRKIDKLIFKGYDDFPKSFIKNYLNISSNTIFNKKKLAEISKLSKTLGFASEIKLPETLFTKDSTFIYVYLKKKKGSSFDGLINFASQENGKLQFNGYLNLKLKNILNRGESFNLLWNSFGSERQEFSLAAKTPYIFNSKVSPEFAFSIYKQDSTFLNTKLNTALKYQIRNNSNLFVSFSSENSENLTNASLDNISTFQNYFLGFGYEYKVPKNDVFGNNTFYLNVNPSFGRRKTDTNSFQQIKITTTASYLLDFNTRHHIYFSNKTGLLNSENYLNNELFRIGGNKTIRGFKEQSLFVKNYILQNIEYRYNTSKNSYAYTITDLALISSEKEHKKLYSLGLGYLFNTNTSQINISTAIGIDIDNPINFKNTLFFVNWISFF
ncbi:MAG: hypothetical protein ACI9JT_002422 [Polaribacter sp.]